MNLTKDSSRIESALLSTLLAIQVCWALRV